ncbi:MAG TPA: IclR family transcriptional regulator C-terminal domain-containing protein [Alphaproteobacteria bacterium]|jgi:IclR family pca regulon transcriptional regulator
MTKGDSEYVQTLARGLSVIRVFGPNHQKLTLTDVARRADLTRAAARRFLLTLKRLGYVKSDDGKYFSLQPQVLNLGYAYLSSIPWWEVAQRYMEEVSAAIEESCSAAVLDGTDIVYVARVATRRIMTMTIGIGSRMPAYATSMGRVLLAHQEPEWLEEFFAKAPFEPITDKTVVQKDALRKLLSEVKLQGYCIVDQELENGVRSIAVPLFDRSGRCQAAINVGTHVARVSKAQLVSNVLPALQEASKKITAAWTP